MVPSSCSGHLLRRSPGGGNFFENVFHVSLAARNLLPIIGLWFFIGRESFSFFRRDS
jgi:hypothetical protein